MSDAYDGLHLTFVRCVQNSFMETDIKLLGKNEFSWVDFSKTPGLEGILLGKLLGKHKIKVRSLCYLIDHTGNSHTVQDIYKESIFKIHILQGTDFIGTSGFDALVKRLKEGRHMCREYGDYIRARWVKSYIH